MAIKQDGSLDLEIMKLIASLIPDDKYKFALGTGKPEDIVNCHKMGWQIFDCVIPTRDARHGRLYSIENIAERKELSHSNINKLLNKYYIKKAIYKKDFTFLDSDLPYTKAYLHHLLKIKDQSYANIASLNNLNTYNKIIDILSKAS